MASNNVLIRMLIAALSKSPMETSEECPPTGIADVREITHVGDEGVAYESKLPEDGGDPEANSGTREVKFSGGRSDKA